MLVYHRIIFSDVRGSQERDSVPMDSLNDIKYQLVYYETYATLMTQSKGKTIKALESRWKIRLVENGQSDFGNVIYLKNFEKSTDASRFRDHDRKDLSVGWNALSLSFYRHEGERVVFVDQFHAVSFCNGFAKHGR